jgi:PBP1b-binding outer membrane lipoprotein LpoB
MKKIISKFFAIIGILLFLSSCSSAKKYKEQSTIVKSEIQKNDSTRTTVINHAIEDKVITPIVQSKTGNPVLDSLVNAKVDEILQKLNTSKKSGDNSYSLMYDKLTKQLEFYSKMAQTKNENLQVKKQNDKVIIQIKKIPIEIVKPLTKLEKFLMGLGILSLLFLGFKGFVFIRGKTKTLWV